MPTSRTRKKTQDKNRKAAANKEKTDHLKRIFGASVQEVPLCNDCHGERIKVPLSQVAPAHQSGVENMCKELKAAGMEVREIAYCKNCDQYSAFSDWESF
jgi:hypothetical protein